VITLSLGAVLLGGHQAGERNNHPERMAMIANHRNHSRINVKAWREGERCMIKIYHSSNKCQQKL